MNRRIAVAAHCHTGGITAALSGMLPDDTVVPCWAVSDQTALRREVQGADLWVTSLRGEARVTVEREFPDVGVISVPDIWFPGFHPDIIHVPHPDGGMLQSPAGDYNSAIVLWGWKHGLTMEQILARFSAETVVALMYPWRWSSAVDHLRSRFEDSDLDFARYFLPLRRGGTFMLSDNHPRVDGLVQIARQVGVLLGATRDLVAFPWESVLPDALLATGPVWPVYPAVAEVLGLRGGYVWRQANGTMLTLEGFVAASLAAYDAIDPLDVKVPAFDHPRWDAVLPPEPSRSP